MSGDAISTTNVWPYYSAGNVQKAAEKPKDGTLGKDDFLKILITQLQNQDPMQPLEDKDFIAQMAQFSSVEQLTNMADEMAKLRQNLGMASTMIGKSAQWYETADTGELVPKSGIVDSIVIRDGAQFARIGDTDVSLDDIVAIGTAAEPTDPPADDEGGEAEPPADAQDPATGDGGQTDE